MVKKIFLLSYILLSSLAYSVNTIKIENSIVVIDHDQVFDDIKGFCEQQQENNSNIVYVLKDALKMLSEIKKLKSEYILLRFQKKNEIYQAYIDDLEYLTKSIVRIFKGLQIDD